MGKKKEPDHYNLGELLKLTTAKSAKKTGVELNLDYDLRSSRRAKKELAAVNPSWTLFVNKRGSLCYAVHKNGVCVILEAPAHYHGCLHEEYAANYFLNTIKETMVGLVK